MSPTSTQIRSELTIVPDQQTCRFLGAWVGNDVPYLTPWPEVIETISRDLTRWNAKSPTLERRRHVINMINHNQDAELTFDPDYRLTGLSQGFRIFAFEDHMTQVPTKQFKLPQAESTTHDVYLHAKIKHPGQAHAKMEVMLLVRTRDNPDVLMKHLLLLSFLDKKILPSFNTVILGGLLYIVRELSQDIPLNIHCCSNFLGKALVTNHNDSENNRWAQIMT
ncbi:hypothetical protein C8R44DRAFT_647200 [Mycena epipterygia]|nr:hypothetical protein C8R44DRAFT_647200 [Mycena epipterygia]